MFGGRVITICREGWYYLFVVSFILLGAVLREINLLVLLAGLLLGALLFCWRLVAVSTRELSVARQCPRRVSAGEFIPVYLTVRNGRRRIANYLLVAQDQVQREGSPRRERSQVEVVLPFIPPGQERSASYRVRVSRRGRYRLGPLRLSTRFPLGLVRGSAHLRQESTFIVCPRVGQLSPNWQKLIRGDRSGAHAARSRAGSSDGDFYALREWRAGDSRHLIHWRTSARIGGLAVRQLEQRTTPSLVIVVDLCQPRDLAQDSAALMKVEYALSFAATAINDLTNQGRSTLVFALAAEAAETWTAPVSALFSQELLDHLATVRPGDGRTLLEVMERSIGLRPLGAKIVVISTRSQLAAGPAANPHDLGIALEWLDVGDPSRMEALFRLQAPDQSPAEAAP